MKILALLIAALGLSSCAQTGDPSSGGLFGWSDAMYQQDMAVKRGTLNSINQDTQYQRSQASGVQSQINSQR